MESDENTIRAYLTEEENRFYRFRLYDTVPSTNTLLKEAAEKDTAVPSGTVVIAAQQTAGHGRRGRQFFSPPGTGIYMSILIRPTLPPEKALAFTTDTAVAVAESVEALTAKKAEIKWVNDVYLGGKKVCGILAEAALTADLRAFSYVVIGIGVNVRTPDGGFPAPLADSVTAVFGADADETARDRLTAEILHRLYPMLQAPGDRRILDAYRSRSLLDGKAVRVRRAGAGTAEGEELPAVALYIDENAGLRVRYADGTEETLTSGEVSVHPDRQ